ncbi:hypothetical protein HKX48_007391 [Thoreauomyces humboldtii]|nr:hypothetical protein HKX48_007391 [Thoreauomyces humboldtii]
MTAGVTATGDMLAEPRPPPLRPLPDARKSILKALFGNTTPGSQLVSAAGTLPSTAAPEAIKVLHQSSSFNADSSHQPSQLNISVRQQDNHGNHHAGYVDESLASPDIYPSRQASEALSNSSSHNSTSTNPTVSTPKILDDPNALLPSLLSSETSFDDNNDVWKLFTKVKEAFPNGARLENMTWRLMHLQKKRELEREKKRELETQTGIAEVGTVPSTPSLTEWMSASEGGVTEAHCVPAEGRDEFLMDLDSVAHMPAAISDAPQTVEEPFSFSTAAVSAMDFQYNYFNEARPAMQFGSYDPSMAPTHGEQWMREFVSLDAYSEDGSDAASMVVSPSPAPFIDGSDLMSVPAPAAAIVREAEPLPPPSMQDSQCRPPPVGIATFASERGYPVFPEPVAGDAGPLKKKSTPSRRASAKNLHEFTTWTDAPSSYGAASSGVQSLSSSCTGGSWSRPSSPGGDSQVPTPQTQLRQPSTQELVLQLHQQQQQQRASAAQQVSNSWTAGSFMEQAGGAASVAARNQAAPPANKRARKSPDDMDTSGETFVTGSLPTGFFHPPPPRPAQHETARAPVDAPQGAPGAGQYLNMNSLYYQLQHLIEIQQNHGSGSFSGMPQQGGLTGTSEPPSPQYTTQQPEYPNPELLTGPGQMQPQQIYGFAPGQPLNSGFQSLQQRYSGQTDPRLSSQTHSSSSDLTALLHAADLQGLLTENQQWEAQAANNSGGRSGVQ